MTKGYQPGPASSLTAKCHGGGKDLDFGLLGPSVTPCGRRVVLLNGCLVFGAGVRTDHMDARIVLLPFEILFLRGWNPVVGAAHRGATKAPLDAKFKPIVKIFYFFHLV